MYRRIGALRTLCALLVAGVFSLGLAACGSSDTSSQANTLLKQTFSGAHPVNSGDLNFSLIVTPSGSSTLRTPISLSFGGPFQSTGKGNLPKSNFSVNLSAEGAGGTLGVLSTGTNGYVTLQGVSYQLPQATFRRLESSFQGLSSSPGGSGSGTLAKLGIHPLNWLTNPFVVGQETVGGTNTTHIRASINVASLLGDLNTFLQKASSVGVTGANRVSSSLSATTRSTIAGEVRNPSFDVWTGSSDKTVRKLVIGLTLPVSGQTSTLLGGLRSAAITLTMSYANLNQPQTITPPTSVRPYSEFTAKLHTFLSSLQSGLGTLGGAGGVTGSSSSSGSSSTSTTASGSSSASSKVQRYSNCIVNAHSDVAKMQKCASLINGQ